MHQRLGQRCLHDRLGREAVQSAITESKDADVRVTPCQYRRGNDASGIDLAYATLAKVDPETETMV